MVTDAVFVVHVFAFLFLVHALTVVPEPLAAARGGERVKTTLVEEALRVLNWCLAIKGHIAHYDAHIFRCNEAVAIEVVHLERELHLLV